MAAFDVLRAKLEAAIDNQDFSNAEHAANTYTALAKAEKLERETELLEKSRTQENLRFWVPVLGALLSATAIFGTFLAGILQHRDDARQAVLAQQEATYATTLQTIQREGQATAIGSAMLASLLTSDPNVPHAGEARAVAIVLLSHAGDPTIFRMLFRRLVATTTVPTFQDIIELNRDILEAWHHVNDMLHSMGQRRGPPRFNPMEYPPMEVPSPDDLNTLAEQLSETRSVIAAWWGEHGVAPNADLSDVDLEFTDLDGIDFGQADLSRTDFTCASVRNANFSSVQAGLRTSSNATGFDETSWTGVAWWQAKLSPAIRAYLLKYYPQRAYNPRKQCAT